MICRKIIIASVCGFCHLMIQAQSKFILSISTSESEKNTIQKISFQKTHSDSAKAVFELKNILFSLHQQGYLLASFDTVFAIKDTLKSALSIGKKFRWANLSHGNLPENIQTAIGYREKLYHNHVFSYSEVEKLEEKILEEAENHGFPFATVKLDSVQIREDKFKAVIKYDPGFLFVFDTISVTGSAKFKSGFLALYLRIFKGEPFSQQKVDKGDLILKKMPYLTLSKASTLVFKNEKVYLNVFANEKKANQFDGIIGFLPNETQNNNKLLVTGEVNFKINNLFRSGKSFSLMWQQIKPLSPVLNVQYKHPSLFRTSLEADFQLYLLKQDTTFLNITRRLGISQRLNNTGKIGFLLNYQTSFPLGSNAKYENIETLPVYLNTQLLSYGIEYSWNNLDNILYPKRGFEFYGTASVGNKKIIPNAVIKEELYAGLTLVSLQTTVKMDAKKYFKVGKSSTFMLRMQAGNIWNDNLIQNELYRLGGLTTIRGFNENTFFASGYGIATAEYRFFMEEEAYFFGFFDQSYFQTKTQNTDYSDNPSAAGLGLSFSTKSGIFNLVYAVGKSAQQPFGLNYSRIHFGFTSRF